MWAEPSAAQRVEQAAVGGAVGGAVGAVGGVAGSAAGAIGGAVGAGAIGGVAGSAAGAVGGVARGAGTAMGGVAGTAGDAIGSSIGTVGRAAGTASAPAASALGSQPTSGGGFLGGFGAPSPAARSLAAPSQAPARTAPQASSRLRSWTLAPPRRVSTLLYFPIESLYRRKPWQIRELLVRLDRDQLRALRVSCRQVLAAPRSFTYERVQVCRVALSL